MLDEKLVEKSLFDKICPKQPHCFHQDDCPVLIEALSKAIPIIQSETRVLDEEKAKSDILDTCLPYFDMEDPCRCTRCYEKAKKRSDIIIKAICSSGKTVAQVKAETKRKLLKELEKFILDINVNAGRNKKGNLTKLIRTNQ